MGFNVTALAQKARTKTIIVDSDLDMGQYDVIATDVKGDTAEFSEFVGGVGNFESGLVSGGFDVSGILHAESNLQVDGGISLEGSINNVNITPNGEIITAQSVNASEFVGDVGNFSSCVSSSYIINLMISSEGINYGNVAGSSIIVGENTTKTIPSVTLPKNIGLFTVGNIVGDAPNYQIILTTDTNYTHEFFIVCNGNNTTLYVPAGTSTYTFDTNVSVLEDLTATIHNNYTASYSTQAYIKIPNMFVSPAQ